MIPVPSFLTSAALLVPFLGMASLMMSQTPATTEALKYKVQQDIPYAEPSNPRQMLDIYAPVDAKSRPVVVWIHGGGWEKGDKKDAREKPAAFVDKGMLLVMVNHRFLPGVLMEDIVKDVAKAICWVHDNAAKYGGDPNRILVMGHSSGAQLAALICTDEKYLKAEGLSLAIIKGCVPVDGDTYDVPFQIATAMDRRHKEGKPEPKFGHREKFGDLALQRKFSAVTHVARDKSIPPFLLLHVAGHADTTAQAQRLWQVLEAAEVPANIFAAPATDHSLINRNLGLPEDPSTKALFAFVEEALQR